VSLYGQQPEAGLLASFLVRLDHRDVVDVGAERGAFVGEMLLAGSPAVHAIEPEPENVAFLRSTYGGDPRVVVHGVAAGDVDGELALHRSVTRGGAPVSFAHTMLDPPDAAEIAWADTVSVPARSLSSLVESGEVPARVGVVTIDTEGYDLAVVRGMGSLDADVVMVEQWTDVPLSLGPCPWTSDEMAGALVARGFSNFASLLHLGELVIVQWNEGHVPGGSVANLVFIHDRVIDLLLPAVLDTASALARQAAEAAGGQASLATALQSSVAEISRERDVQARAAAERLARLDELAAEHAGSVEELTRQLQALARERDLQASVAEERLVAIEELKRERDLMAEAAEERLTRLEELGREHEEIVEQLERERDLQASISAERLAVIETLGEARGEREGRPQGWR
jgi:FkbM family methyltransferase